MLQEKTQVKPLLARINEIEQRIAGCPFNFNVDPPLDERLLEIEKTANTSMGFSQSIIHLLEEQNKKIEILEEKIDQLTIFLRETVIKLKMLSEVIYHGRN